MHPSVEETGPWCHFACVSDMTFGEFMKRFAGSAWVDADVEHYIGRLPDDSRAQHSCAEYADDDDSDKRA